MASEELTVERPAERRPSAGLAFLKELVFVVVGAIIVSSLLRAFVGQMFIIPSDSMQNTLLQGDRVVVQKVTDFHRGNVVVFKDPADWLGDEPTEDPTATDRLLEFVGIPTASSPVRNGSSEKYSKLRPHRGERFMLIPGPRMTDRLAARASWARACPTRPSSSGFQAEAIAEAVGKQVAGSDPPRPR